MATFLVLITASLWGLWHIFSKLAAQRINPVAMQFVFGCCALITVPCYWMYMQHKGIKLSLSTDIGGIGWAVAALAATAIATLSYSIVLTMRPVSEVVSIASAYPVLVCLLAIPIFGEVLTWHKFAGILLVWVGILVLSRG